MDEYRSVKVLLVSPLKGTVGGISRWTSHLLDYYNNSCSDVLLEQLYPETKLTYANTPRLLRLWNGLSIYTPFLLFLYIRLRRSRVDVAHLASSASLGLVRDILFLLILRLTKTKSIVHFRFGRIPELSVSKNWEWYLLKKVVRLSNQTIVLDKESQFCLEQEGFSNVSLLPNPVAPIIDTVVSKCKGIVRKQDAILFAGHIIPSKGVAELIEACAGMAGVKLFFIGKCNDSYREILQEQALSQEVDLVFVGEVDHNQVVEYMLSCAVFVLPSYTEGFPNVVLEAMATSTPVVATNVGAISEMLEGLVNERCGIVVPPKNVVELRSAILKMLDDKRFAKVCGINARKRVVERYSMPAVWQQLVSLWKSI